MTFGTAARRSTAAVGGNLGNMGDRGIILLLMTYDLPNNKDLWARGIDPRLRGSVHSRRSMEIVDLRNMADAEDSYA